MHPSAPIRHGRVRAPPPAPRQPSHLRASWGRTTLGIGAAATATVVAHDDGRDDDFLFTIKNFGEHYDLCIHPIDDGRDFLADPILREWRYDICFGHAASQRAEEGVIRRLSVPVGIMVGIASSTI